MKKLPKVGKYYLVKIINSNGVAVARIKSIKSCNVTEIKAVLASNGETVSLSQSDIVRRVFKIKEGVEYIDKSGRHVSFTKNDDSNATTDYPWRGIHKDDVSSFTYTKFGFFNRYLSCSNLNVVGKVKEKLA